MLVVLLLMRGTGDFVIIILDVYVFRLLFYYFRIRHDLCFGLW